MKPRWQNWMSFFSLFSTGLSGVNCKMSAVPPFSEGQIEALARLLGECGTGDDISRFFISKGLVDNSGESTKWKRLYWVFLKYQKQHQCANLIVDFIQSFLTPARFVGRNDEFETNRQHLNTILSFSGLEYGKDGKFRQCKIAKTLDEAEKRARTIRAKFKGRQIHPEVLKYCRPELLQDNYFHDSAPVNLVTEKDTDGRVFVSTYPTMMKQIEEMNNGQRRFGSGHFDLVIIDEAHRSVFKKYRAIFDYFDSFLVGLTATPKNEIERNTYSLFDLEPGVPTDAYQLEEAVKDGFLVPPKAVSVPLKFQRQGINYDDLSDEDKEQWESLDWGDEDGEIPDRVEAEAVNKWLFNKDTVDKVLAHLMTRGLKVAGDDRLGKTILFAKNQAHAQNALFFNIYYCVPSQGPGLLKRRTLQHIHKKSGHPQI